MDPFEQIIVYDNFSIDLNKYPRFNTDKEKTDIIIIIFLMNQDLLIKLSESCENALKYYHDCKEYYYIFKFNNNQLKKYSANEIIKLINETNQFFRDNNNINIQQNYLKKMPQMDKIYYFYIKNKDFFLNLYESLEHAKKAYFERREYSYKIFPPIDFYNNIPNKTYSAIELMELNSYTQYLVQRKIIQNLPIPKYL
jgi:hypothetical protein